MDLTVRIRNFKSILDTELSLKKGVNILIGPNGSGKTCILNSLMFIRDVIREGVGQAVAKNGGHKRVYHRNQNQISFTIKYDYGERAFNGHKCPHELIWEFDIQQKGSEGEEIPTIVREIISINALKEEFPTTVLSIEIIRNNKKKPDRKINYCEEHYKYPYYDKKILNETIEKALKKVNEDQSLINIFIELDTKIINIFKLYYLFTNLNEYNIFPEIARQESELLPYAEMLPDGKGLTNVIHALEKKNYKSIKSSGTMQQLVFISHLEFTLDNINTELAQAVKPINKVTTETNKYNGKKVLNFKTYSDNFYPEEVSDGTIKWLAKLVSLYVPFSDIYLIEEPENFLHPWMQQRLIKIMREEAIKSNTFYILATHSPVILNKALPEEVLTVKMDDKNSTIVKRLSDINELKEFLDSSEFGLGDLWVSGSIGAVPGE